MPQRTYATNEDRIEAARPRVLARVIKADGCWTYQGAHNGHGYGVLSVTLRTDDGKFYPGRLMAHRVVYEHHVGPIPESMEIDHICRNKWCCRPDHLEPVTHEENMRRALGRGETPCPHGHVNRFVIGPHGRRCLECKRLAAIAARRR